MGVFIYTKTVIFTVSMIDRTSISSVSLYTHNGVKELPVFCCCKRYAHCAYSARPNICMFDPYILASVCIAMRPNGSGVFVVRPASGCNQFRRVIVYFFVYFAFLFNEHVL